MVDRGRPRGTGPARPLRTVSLCARIALLFLMGRATIPPCAAQERVAERRTAARVPDAAPSAPGPPGADPAPATIAQFQAHCTLCHDPDGRGATGRETMRNIPDFTSPAWQSSMTDAQLRRAILEGKRSMPAQRDKLGGNDAVKLISLVRRFRGGRWSVPEVEEAEHVEAATPPTTPRGSPRAAPPTPAPAGRDPALSTRAPGGEDRAERAAFLRFCQLCHGADGRGGPLAVRGTAIPDFTDRRWQEGRSLVEFEASILEGKGARMPAFRDKLSGEQVSGLAAFVRSFGPPQAGPASASGSAPSGEFDRQMTRFRREMEDLRRAYREVSPANRTP